MGDEIVEEAIVFVGVVVWIDDEHDARRRTAETRQMMGGHIVFSFIFLPPWSSKRLLKEAASRMI